jgi:hypothetical protein
MEPRRKLFFALIACAMMLNVGYGLVNNGIRIPILGDGTDPSEIGEISENFRVSRLLGGSSFTSRYNMTVEVNLGEDRGVYEQEGILKRSILERSLSKSLTGTYSLVYNGTQDMAFRGEMATSRDTLMDQAGLPEMEDFFSSITFTGPKGFGSSSEAHSTIEQFTGIKMDMIWKALLPDDHMLKTDSTGIRSVPVNLQEAGIRTEEIVLSWNVISIIESAIGRTAKLRATSVSGRFGNFEMSLSFLEGCSWPVSMGISISGEFKTDEGPASIEVEMNEVLDGWVQGQGGELPFIIYDPMGPPVPKSGKSESILPKEGGDTLFRSVPEEVYQVCLDEGSLLGDYIRENGQEGLSMLEAEYYRVDSMDPMWVWNITLSCPPVDGISDTIQFEVGTEGGGLIGHRRYHLLSENAGVSSVHPVPDSDSITLKMNEEMIMECDLSDQFLRGESYHGSYCLDIIRRDTSCCSAVSLMFMNMLGVEKAQVKDLFISRSLDRADPSRMYFAVVDGQSGALISTTEIEGAAVTLFNAYGFDLA